MKPIAEVRISCGRTYLSVNGVTVAVETDPCKDIHMAELAREDEYVEIKGYSVLKWNTRLMELAARRINGAKWSEIGCSGTE